MTRRTSNTGGPTGAPCLPASASVYFQYSDRNPKLFPTFEVAYAWAAEFNRTIGAVTVEIAVATVNERYERNRP